MSTWTLTGLGRLPWPDVRARLAGYTCAWVDRYQLRVGDPPAEPPITTHLWGWSDTSYARVRVDGDAGYVGVLRAAGSGCDPGEVVTVTVRRAMMRGAADSSDLADPSDPSDPEGSLPGGLDGPLAVELLEVPGSGPVTFIRPV